MGVVIGPNALALAKDTASIRYLAEFGVVFLMFVIGLEFSLPRLRAVLRRQVAGPLRQASRVAGQRAALEGGVMVAISPSPALDGVLAGLRGLSLVRQVAQIHGLRPNLAVTVALLRRAVWTAAGVSGADLVAQAVSEQVLGRIPVLQHIAAAVPGSSVTALRLSRLAHVTAEACCPLAMEREG